MVTPATILEREEMANGGGENADGDMDRDGALESRRISDGVLDPDT